VKLQWIALALGVTLAGCPRDEPAVTPPPAPVAEPPADDPPSDAPVVAPTAALQEPVVELITDRLAVGTVLRPWDEVSLGLKRVEDLPLFEDSKRVLRPAAVLSVAIGQHHLQIDATDGARFRLGGAVFEILKVDADAVTLRWLESPTGADPPEIEPVTASKQLGEVGFFTFEDGVVLCVGNVLTLAKSDGTPAHVVNLTVFPPNYATDPMQDYDLLSRVVTGKVVGRVRPLELVAVTPAEGDEPGRIRVRFAE
jgi:hypothetical protein